MTTTSHDKVLAAALEVLREQGTVSLDTAARRAEMTKPGVMHHFLTKEALMLGLVDHVANRWHTDLLQHLPAGVDDPSAKQRMRAYLDYSLTTQFDATDLVVLGDVRLRASLAERWSANIGPWLEIGDEVPASQRAALIAVRLIADGLWFATAAAVCPITAPDRDLVRAVTNDLLKD
ncbi:MAG: TetR family transcriptional regulator [Gordonia sp. (in: high G+C Gram-positive bacteria)]|nr:MAG: TetR family transcriptional regulator [Gordonia sp. (in: high G+C Gram-positive bacteria)]